MCSLNSRYMPSNGAHSLSSRSAGLFLRRSLSCDATMMRNRFGEWDKALILAQESENNKIWKRNFWKSQFSGTERDAHTAALTDTGEAVRRLLSIEGKYFSSPVYDVVHY